MNARALTLLVLGLLVAEQCHASVFTRNAQEALEEFAQHAQLTINSGLLQLDDLLEHVQVLRTDTIQNADTHLQAISRTLAAKVQAISDSANEQTQEHVSFCVRLYDAEIEKLPVYARERVETCVMSVESAAASNLAAARTDLQGIRRNFVQTYESRIIECDGDEICAARVFVNILLSTIDIQSRVDTEVTKSVQDLTSRLKYINEDMPRCLNARLDQATSMAELIVRYITRCSEISV